MSIFCFSLKVLSQGSSGENPQSLALIDSTELADLSIATTPWMGCYFLAGLLPAMIMLMTALIHQKV